MPEWARFIEYNKGRITQLKPIRSKAALLIH